MEMTRLSAWHVWHRLACALCSGPMVQPACFETAPACCKTAPEQKAHIWHLGHVRMQRRMASCYLAGSRCTLCNKFSADGCWWGSKGHISHQQGEPTRHMPWNRACQRMLRGSVSASAVAAWLHLLLLPWLLYNQLCTLPPWVPALLSSGASSALRLTTQCKGCDSHCQQHGHGSSAGLEVIVAMYKHSCLLRCSHTLPAGHQDHHLRAGELPQTQPRCRPQPRHSRQPGEAALRADTPPACNGMGAETGKRTAVHAGEARRAVVGMHPQLACLLALTAHMWRCSTLDAQPVLFGSAGLLQALAWLASAMHNTELWYCRGMR